MLEYIVGLLLIILAGWILLMATGWSMPYDSMLQMMGWFQNNPFKSVLIAFIILAVAVFLLKRPRSQAEESYVSRTKDGEVRITRGAMSDIIVRSTAEVSGLKNVRTRIKQRENGLELSLTCQLEEGLVISKISEEIQEIVKNGVELYTGMPVTEVKVIVRSSKLISTAYKK
ncbi:MAG: alkaline shock response membrane anchor protein AmaP [Eubacteriales bacterium]